MQASRPEIVLWIMFVDHRLIQYQSGSYPYEDWNMQRAYGSFLTSSRESRVRGICSVKL
jgi:hypothetical protein